MPRKIHTRGKWLWKKEGAWQEFPIESNTLLEAKFKEYGEGFVGEIYVRSSFPPFILAQDDNRATVRANYREKTLEINNLSYQLRREGVFDPPANRAAIDVQCGVLSLPLFPHPFITGEYGIGDIPMTHKEQLMIALSAEIREKPDWERKFRDSDILQKWRAEARQIDDDMFSYVIDELDYYQSIAVGPIKPSAVDGVWQADGLIPESLRDALLREVCKLEAGEKDWHPGSNGQVLDLVHPSLYCFVAGVTPQTTTPAHPPFAHIGGGQVLTTDLLVTPETQKLTPLSLEMSQRMLDFDHALEDSFDEQTHSNRIELFQQIHAMQQMLADSQVFKSSTYQWLPTEFSISKSGQVSVESYINNLDYRNHKPLYKILTGILESFVPMFEKVLTDLVNPHLRRYAPDYFAWYKDEGFSGPEDTREFSLPAIPPFKPPRSPENPVSLLGRRIQVIVKLANIILTPENPKYEGGVWHVEGMRNEQIVASGIYYYDSENITESRLNFRVGICEPQYEQYDKRGVMEVYRLADEQQLNQNLGSVITQSGRALVFPNLYQHQVAPFSLKDPTKPGHRKILVYFLVDPSVYILSTLYVPPQQPLWYFDTLKQFYPFSILPENVLLLIVSFTFPLSKENAEKHRLQLMQERKFFIQQNSEQLFERPFSLCEH